MLDHSIIIAKGCLRMKCRHKWTCTWMKWILLEWNQLVLVNLSGIKWHFHGYFITTFPPPTCFADSLMFPHLIFPHLIFAFGGKHFMINRVIVWPMEPPDQINIQQSYINLLTNTSTHQQSYSHPSNFPLVIKSFPPNKVWLTFAKSGVFFFS